MKCKICETDKLSREFPPNNFFESCFHPQVVCLQCYVDCFTKNGSLICPCSEECTSIIGQDIVEEMKSQLDKFFPPLSCHDRFESIDSGDVVQVALIDGTLLPYNFKKENTVLNLKKFIEGKKNISITKQRLKFQGNELKVFTPTRSLMTLGEYNIQSGNVIHLIVLLFKIPENLTHVVFDLFWGLSEHTDTYLDGSQEKVMDFMDASCIMFAGSNEYKTIDYQNDQLYNAASKSMSILHSGDMIDRNAKVVHQHVEVKLKLLPKEVTHLFFVLSCWNRNSVQCFKTPTLKLFDINNLHEDLCTTSLSEVIQREAVVICCVQRVSDDAWAIIDTSELIIKGNTDHYEEMKVWLLDFMKKVLG